MKVTFANVPLSYMASGENVGRLAYSDLRLIVGNQEAAPKDAILVPVPVTGGMYAWLESGKCPKCGGTGRAC